MFTYLLITNKWRIVGPKIAIRNEREKRGFLFPLWAGRKTLQLFANKKGRIEIQPAINPISYEKPG
jgi:hypothetical protein